MIRKRRLTLIEPINSPQVSRSERGETMGAPAGVSTQRRHAYPCRPSVGAPLTSFPEESKRPHHSVPDDLAAALRRAATAHGEHETRIGQEDPDWPDWYAQYMVAESAGTELPN